MSAHTPGPWTYKATAGNHDFAVYPEEAGRDVALVREFHEANARLIAAAPDLLEVARWVVDWFGNMQEKNMEPEEFEVLAEARSAIAKATGEA